MQQCVETCGGSLVGGVPLALPLGTATVTWLGRCELQVGTATALGVCMPPSESPSLSMIFLCFPSPLFGVSRRNFEKMHLPAVISGRQTITLGLQLLSAVNRRFVVPCTKEISLKVLIPSSFLQALVK